jgi:HAD superfamily phosphoserine phosphatase-like hydrolase
MSDDMSSTMMQSPSLQLVIFDMDGVVFEGRNFWLDLHRAMGTEKEAWHLWQTLGASDYKRLCTLTVQDLWRGRGAEAFFDLIASRRYVDGIFDVVAWLREHGIRTAIVSTGAHQLAERAQRDLQFDAVRANRVLIHDNGFAGEVEVMVDENHKDMVAREIMTSLQVDAARTAMIGDSRSDISMAASVGLPIAYNPETPELAAAVRHVLPAGALRGAIDLVARYRPAEPAATREY